MEALQAQERRRAEVQARLGKLEAPRPTREAAVVRRKLQGYVADWQRLLRAQVGQAQQALRRLVVGRLTLTPRDVGVFGKRPFYAFSGVGTVRPVLGGIVQKLASPISASWNQLKGWLRAVDGLRRAA